MSVGFKRPGVQDLVVLGSVAKYAHQSNNNNKLFPGATNTSIMDYIRFCYSEM